VNAPTKTEPLTRKELGEWLDWFQHNKSYMLDIVASVERLANEANGGMRLLNPPSNQHDRYDEIEDERNRVLKAVCMLLEDETAIADRMTEIWRSMPSESEAAE
jgi:hypothetical protein